jgi:hypothetical protein
MLTITLHRRALERTDRIPQRVTVSCAQAIINSSPIDAMLQTSLAATRSVSWERVISLPGLRPSLRFGYENSHNARIPARWRGSGPPGTVGSLSWKKRSATLVWTIDFESMRLAAAPFRLAQVGNECESVVVGPPLGRCSPNRSGTDCGVVRGEQLVALALGRVGSVTPARLTKQPLVRFSPGKYVVC